MNTSVIELELLAPARDAQTAITAIDCGADAVYIGAGHHGARAAAANSVDDIRRVCEYAHRFGARIYVTLNTLVYDDELDDVRRLVIDLYGAGVDALIVQDMALTVMDIPPIALHASTQCDVRTPDKARFMEAIGMSQIVLPREFTLDEIRAVRAITTVPLEVFVHGALCVCYSGDCRASYVNGARSANRGECAQICRLPYDLVDGKGNRVDTDHYLLSLRDMNRLADLADLVEAGATSFKIEGRLKSPEYVKNTVLAYSEALNNIVRANPDRYCRASYGCVDTGLRPDVNLTFNRGYTSYFLRNTQPRAGSLASMRTPKHVGREVGRVIRADARSIRLDGSVMLANGDGLGFFDEKGHFVGFRANRVDGPNVFTTTTLLPRPKPGTPVYRNLDKNFADRLSSSRVSRTVGIRATLERTSRGLALTLIDERGHRATSAVDGVFDEAKKPQEETRQALLSRLGDTVYRLDGVDDRLGNIFVQASLLTTLRRRAVAALDLAVASTRPIDRRQRCDDAAVYPQKHLTMHDNVANRVAAEFYAAHGAKVDAKAIEVADKSIIDSEITVMTTRYCLRRELGYCLKTADGHRLAGPLTLVPRGGTVRPMRIDFDCTACRMNIVALPRQ